MISGPLPNLIRTRRMHLLPPIWVASGRIRASIEVMIGGLEIVPRGTGMHTPPGCNRRRDSGQACWTGLGLA